MKRVMIVAGCMAGAYQAGALLGYRLGAENARRTTDWEWARMLENGMVGPGSTTRPGATTGLDSLTLVGGA